jgi:hypothetical protein
MLEFLGNNVNTILLIALLGFKALEYIAPKTETKIDDSIVSAGNWILSHARGAFNIVEDLDGLGIIKGDKAKAYLDKLDAQYFKVYGKPLPDKARKQAEVLAEGFAAEDHNIKRLGLESPKPESPEA